MSGLNQIHTTLNRIFNEAGLRIVFWNDPDQEFFMTMPRLELDGVTAPRPIRNRSTWSERSFTPGLQQATNSITTTRPP